MSSIIAPHLPPSLLPAEFVSCTQDIKESVDPPLEDERLDLLLNVPTAGGRLTLAVTGRGLGALIF